jgi:hypothetical protein
MAVSPHKSFMLFCCTTFFEEIIAETIRYVSKSSMNVCFRGKKKHFNQVRWAEVTSEELIFHSAMLNIAKHVKCSITDLFSEVWLDFYKNIFSRRRFLQLYWGLQISFSPSLLGLELQINIYSP